MPSVRERLLRNKFIIPQSDGRASQTRPLKSATIPGMTPDSLVRAVRDFLAGARDAVVLEDGAISFDLSEAKYSVSGEYNKCLLHLWSNERNVVRRILDVHVKNDTIRFAVQRLGSTKPGQLEICRQRDRRPSAASAPQDWLISGCFSGCWSGNFRSTKWCG